MTYTNFDARPRWLVEKGHVIRAKHVLFSLREGTCSPNDIASELSSITADVQRNHQTGRTFTAVTLSLFRDKALFARLWRAFLLQFMAQMCGATAMKYYLPTLLKALGLDTRLALMAGAVEMTAKIGMTIVEMWIIDRFGRRVCIIGGGVVMGTAMLVGLIIPKRGRRALSIG